MRYRIVKGYEIQNRDGRSGFRFTEVKQKNGYGRHLHRYGSRLG